MEGRGAKGLRALIARLEDPDLLPPPGDDDGVPGIWAWCRGKPEEDGIFGRGWEVEEEEEDGRAPPFFHSKKAKVPGRNETIHQTKPNHHASISKGGGKEDETAIPQTAPDQEIRMDAEGDERRSPCLPPQLRHVDRGRGGGELGRRDAVRRWRWDWDGWKGTRTCCCCCSCALFIRGCETDGSAP